MAAGQAGAAPTPPAWVQLTPRGEVTARDGRVFSFHPETLVAAFVAGGLNLPIDFEHESEFTLTLGARPARGWIAELQARPEGTFGRIEWLADAVTALAARAYRYISPTLWLQADGKTARLLKGAALVTSPALGMPAVASASTQERPMNKEILALLGLPETATATEAVSAIAILKAGDPTKFVPKAQHDETLVALAAAQATLKAGEDAAQAVKCSTLVDDAIKGGKVAPAAREQYLALAKGNFDATKAAIDAMPVVLRAGEDPAIRAAPGGASSDAVALGAKARSYMDEQLAKGITVSAADAVAHVQGAAK